MAVVIMNTATGVVHKKTPEQQRSLCGHVSQEALETGVLYEKVWAPIQAVSCGYCLEALHGPKNKKQPRRRKRKRRKSND